MAIGLLGRKVGMTQIFDEAGAVIPVTVIECGPCHVLRLRTKDRDGYEAVQLGFLDRPRDSARRSDRGQVARLDSKRAKALAAQGVAVSERAGCEPKRFVRELRGGAEDLQALVEELKVGTELKVGIFQKVQAVDITGTSKGRGYAGVIKRHNYRGQRASHGVKKVHRLPGSIGNSQFPGHVVKGRRMAGHLGDARCTMRNLKVVRIDAEQNLLLVRGAVPGPNGGLLVIRQTNKLK